MIYLDNAATSFHRPPEVGEAVLWAMGHLGNDSRGTHGAALESGRVIYETRELLAELFGAAGPEQVAFTSNATEALNTAIKGILRPGDRAVTTVLEHNSVLRPLYEMEKMGAWSWRSWGRRPNRSEASRPPRLRGPGAGDYARHAGRDRHPRLQSDRQSDGYPPDRRNVPPGGGAVYRGRLPDGGDLSH